MSITYYVFDAFGLHMYFVHVVRIYWMCIVCCVPALAVSSYKIYYTQMRNLGICLHLLSYALLNCYHSPVISQSACLSVLSVLT